MTAQPAIEVNAAHSEALVRMEDGSHLEFRHTVTERWIKAHEPPGVPSGESSASRLLERIRMFRLNAKHLVVQFTDGTNWEWRFAGAGQRSES